MKKFYTLIFTLLILGACSKPDYAKITITLKNTEATKITLAGAGVYKDLELKDGKFSDTIHLKEPVYLTFTLPNNKRGFAFLNKGYDVQVSADANNLLKTMIFKGKGEKANRLIVADLNFRESIGIAHYREWLNLEEDVFKAKVLHLNKGYDSILEQFTDADTLIFNSSLKNKEQLVQFLNNAYERNKKMRKGQPSPEFTNYMSYKGKAKSLPDFKGKYVYIDLWASWCAPCIQQIPYLKELKKEYKGKKFEIVSISTDSDRKSGTWENAEKSWRGMVEKQQLSGIQLWAGQDIQFAIDYQVTGIPRFILLDPEGKIIDANAPRPTDPRLKELLKSLNL